MVRYRVYSKQVKPHVQVKLEKALWQDHQACLWITTECGVCQHSHLSVTFKLVDISEVVADPVDRQLPYFKHSIQLQGGHPHYY